MIHDQKVVKVGGILSFCIDYSDHYSHTDPSISDLNFRNILKVNGHNTTIVVISKIGRAIMIIETYFWKRAFVGRGPHSLLQRR